MPFKPIKNLDPNDGLNDVRVDLINKYRLIASSDNATLKQQIHALARIEFLAGLSATDPGDEDEPAVTALPIKRILVTPQSAEETYTDSRTSPAPASDVPIADPFGDL